jgi:16S rRNA (cytosine967-C5)-methyltransferase
LAWEILQRVEEGGYADALLGHRLRRSGLDPRDQSLATRLVYGTLAWQGYLDHILAAFSRRAPADLDPPIRSVMRLALFQLCVLSRIPDFAAVDTAVSLAKRFRGGTAVSLVNAVLRRATRGWQDVPFPSPADDLAAALASRWSHPRWLVERWLQRYGADETLELLRANNEPAPTVLRVNSMRADRSQVLTQVRNAGWSAEPTTYSPAGIAVTGGGPPEAVPGYLEGVVSIQAEASQLIGFLVGAEPGQHVLDACAAPGGKTTHLAEIMGDRGTIVALDPHPAGIARLSRMAQRLRLSIIKPQVADALVWSPAARLGQAVPFDRVLVDAPCSGLGTLRAHPEVKWRRTPADVASLASLQLDLLLHLRQYVAPGGALIYATCTLTDEENEAIVAELLRRDPAFGVDDPRPLLPPATHPLIGTDGALRTLPHRHGLDGFYAVRLRHL